MKYQELIIPDSFTVLQAMESLDLAAKKVLFLTKDSFLVGAISDGDIRRWILSKGDLNELAIKVANLNPKLLPLEEKHKAQEFMKRHDIQAVPIIDGDNRVIEIAVQKTNNIISDADKIDAPVVMMAGGFGTRLYPYTKILPKPLIPIGDLPIAEHIINRFNLAGCNQFYLVVNHKKNMIKAYFNEIERDYDIDYVDEDVPLGTGGGLSLLKGKIDKTFLFTNCDILITEDISAIYKYHKQEKNVITMVCSLQNYKIPYGVVEFGENGCIESLKEKPQLTFFTNTGLYIVEPEVIDNMEENTFIGFPDIVERLMHAGEKVGAYPISENSWLDMGEMDELEKMTAKLSLE